jgi:8-hydroxy-5-deazaflavin:NADPH oxidoreductase
LEDLVIIGIVGAGGIGQAFAGQVAKAGYDVVVSNSRGPESLATVVSQIGSRAKAGTREEAAQADVVVVAVRWLQVPSALSGLPGWNGRILIDATNPIIEPGFRLAELGGGSSSEVVASHAPGARVVKVANTLPRALLASDPEEAGGHRVLFMSGDDPSAKAEVSGILQKAKFATIDLGSLASGGRLQQVPGGLLTNLNLIKLG